MSSRTLLPLLGAVASLAGCQHGDQCEESRIEGTVDWFVEGDQGTVVLWYDDSDEYRVEKPIEVGGTFEFADVLPGTVNLMAFVEGRDGFSCDSDVVTLITCGADYEVEIASIATCETG